MNKDLIKTLIVLTLVIVGVSVSIAFFTRPKESGAPSPSGQAAAPAPGTASQPEVSSAGPFEKEGTISAVDPSSGMIAISTTEGEFRANIRDARIFDESGRYASLSYLSRGIKISVKGANGEVKEVNVVLSPDVIIFSPAQNSPVGIAFRIDGAVKMGEGRFSVTVKNRRTGTVYVGEAAAVSAGQGRYGNFSFAVNLSSALDIMDGDNLEAEISREGMQAAFISWRYAGGLASKIKVFFVRNEACGSVQAVERLIDASKSAVRSGIEEIIKGPLSEEKENGYATAIPSSVKITSLEFIEGVITVDLSSAALNKGPVCGASAMRRQLVETIGQFPGISEVVILVNGEEKNPLNP